MSVWMFETNIINISISCFVKVRKNHMYLSNWQINKRFSMKAIILDLQQSVKWLLINSLLIEK